VNNNSSSSTPPPPPPNTAKPLPNPAAPVASPQIVVVSADNSEQQRMQQIERTDLAGNVTPPRPSPLNRLRPGPKDTIPIAGKPPRKQRSSRFVVTERVDIERLPPFMGIVLLVFHN
jgi:serine/threonine-protein phosphatase 2A regulatory subunit B'